ncbi:MAG: response regulator [Anaerolinea sp.]|nr:response regulator [Anaerolinea sp.]
MRILIIDDEKWLLENVATILEFEGYEVITAPDGLSGVRAAREYMPDCIVCDIMMPELDGYGVLKELQSQLSTASIPFIFLTARSDQTHRRLGMNLGADDYLTKPFTDDELLAAIRSRAEKQRLRELQHYQQLADHLVDSYESEKRQFANNLRTRIYTKLHDLQLALKLSQRLPRDSLSWALEHLHDLVEQLTTDTEQILQEFEPYLLQETGLIPALEWFFSGQAVTIHFEFFNIQGRFEEKIERAVYRIVQQSLRLIAGRCQITLWYEHRALHLQITFDTPLIEDQEALTNMVNRIREYAQHCRGVVDAQLNPPCAIHLIIPEVSEQVLDVEPTEVELNAPILPQQKARLFLHFQDPNLQRTLAQYFKLQSAFQVVETDPNLDDLRDSLRQSRPDLLVTDISDTISADYLTLYLSLYDSPAYINTIFQKGARGVMLKAYAAADLPRAIEAVLGGQLFVGEGIQQDQLSFSNTAVPFTAFSVEKLLTHRELEILNLILADKSHIEIGETLLISARTVEKHRANLMQKLGLHSHTELILFAVRQGMIRA